MMVLDFFSNVADYLPHIGIIVASVILLIVLARVILHTLNWFALLKRDIVVLELTPSAFSTKTALATTKFVEVLHGLRSVRTWRDKLLRRDITFSLSMGSRRSTGIQYLISLDKKLAPSVNQFLSAYLPDAKVALKTKYTPALTDKGTVIEFEQTGHFAFPLATHFSFDQHDPIAFITSAMANLDPKEYIGFQLVVTPCHIKEASTLSHKILGNEDLLTQLSHRHKNIFPKLFGGVNMLLFGVLDIFSSVTSPKPGHQGYSDTASQRQAYDRLQVTRRQKPARQLSTFEQELMSSIHDKLCQPLFKVTIRIFVVMDTPAATKERISALKSSMESYAVPSYQGLHRKFRLPLLDKYRRFLFFRNMPGFTDSSSTVLSASEIASLYHFPIEKMSKTDNLITSLSKSLPAPVSLKGDVKLDVIIGENAHHGVITPIGLTNADRERHIFIIGGTGNGKTTLLQHALIQDMRQGKGVAVIDPHGDMAETLLEHVPKDRINDVVYFNPDDIQYPIGLNLLELPPNLNADELIREKDIVTEALVSVFRKIFSEDDSGGHRIEYVLRNAIQTALTVPDATIFTVYDLLNDKKYRTKVLAKLKNKDLQNFWTNELGKAGDMQRVKMAAGITAKIGRFLFSASAKRILEQPQSTIDFEDIINSGKILICNFSKGLIGEDTSELFGITILAKLQLASLRRARIKQKDRKPFYLYVDEFQNFATVSFVQMLSESRKYKLFLTMAEQSTSQQEDQQMINIILANVGTVICFRTGNPQDEKLLLPLFSPFVDEREISNQSPYNFYAKISAVRAQEPLSGHTLLLESAGSEQVAAAVIESSRKQYATKVDTALNEVIDDVEEPTTKPLLNEELIDA